MTRRSVHRKGTPEKVSHESAIKYIMQDNKVIKTANNVYLLRGLFFGWVTGELSTLRQMMEVPNEPGLCRTPA